MAVAPGPQTKIENVGVAILGDIICKTKICRPIIKNALNNWSLPVGDAFNQSDWSSSKTAVLSAVTRKKYPLATLSHSQATINPTQNTADLSVTVESRQPVYFGDIDISGTQRYPVSVARGLAQFSPARLMIWTNCSITSRRWSRTAIIPVHRCRPI